MVDGEDSSDELDSNVAIYYEDEESTIVESGKNNVCFGNRAFNWNNWNGDGKYVKEGVTSDFKFTSSDWTEINAKSWALYNNEHKNESQQSVKYQPKIGDLLDFNLKSFLKVMQNKKVVFFGDSLSKNHAMSLWSMFRSLVGPNVPATIVDYGIMYNITQTRQKMTCYSMLNVTVCFYRENCYLHQEYETMKRIFDVNENDVVVMNTGAHALSCYTDEKECQADGCYTRRIELITEKVSADQKSKSGNVPSFLWREFSARHYKTKKGSYCTKEEMHKCATCAWPHDKVKIEREYLNKDDRYYLNGRRYREKLVNAGFDILPTWRASYLIGPDSHPGLGDCTHFVSVGILRAWNEMFLSWMTFKN